MKIFIKLKDVFNSSRTLSLTGKAAALLLLVFAGIFAFRQIYSPDIGFHLGTGRWMLENLRFPANDVFSYTVVAHKYIDMQWLYQIIITLVNNFFGSFGLVVLNALLIMLSFFLVMVRFTRRQKLGTVFHWQWIMFLGIAAAAIIFETRPHTFSWVYLNLVLLVLEDYADGVEDRLKFLPFIMLLWTNTHSLFVLGWMAIGSYMLGTAWHERKIWNRMTKYGLISIGISLINPYFLGGVAYPFQQFQLLQNASIFKNYIGELLSPLTLNSYFQDGSFMLFNSLFWFHVFLAVSIVSFIIRLKRIRLHELLVFLFFVYLACTAIKNIAFFIFAVLPATINGFQPRSSSEPAVRETRGKIPVSQIILNGIVTAVCIIFIVAISSDAYYIDLGSNLRFGYAYNNYRLPDRAVQYLLDNHLEGKILNHFNFGGFLIYRMPQKVAIDGRLEVMGQEFFLKYLNDWNPIDKGPILSKYKPEIVIFPHESEFLWIHYFKQDTSWRLLYFDEFAAVYLKKGYADAVPAYAYQAQLGRYKTVDDSQIDSILHRRYAAESLKARLTGRYSPISELGLSTFCYYDDRFKEAVQICLNGLMRSSEEWPELYYNLGHNFYEMKDFERAQYCYRRFLETQKDRLAFERVALIQSGKAGRVRPD